MIEHAPRSAVTERTPVDTFVHLRWLAVVCQLVLVGATEATSPGSVPLLPVAALIAAVAGTNAVLSRFRELSSAAAGSVLVLDVAGLTGVLALALGPSNPFTALYMVIVAIGAMVLPRALAAGLVAVALGAYGSLYWLAPTQHHMHHDAMNLHLLGMWFAAAVATPFVAYAITTLRRAIDRQALELDQVRAKVARQERLASLATLATGAAHELSTPLGTIAVVARELERRAHPDDAADAQVIREQVERCSDILRRLSARTGLAAGDEPRTVPLSEVVHQACRGLDEGLDVVAQLGEPVEVWVPPEPVARALRGLIDNALDASPADEPARLERGEVSDEAVEIHIVDRGEGIPDEVLARIGEPFFTTKGEEGMGLGVFFAQSLLDQLGGGIAIRSSHGQGTTVTVRLPRRPL